MIRKQFVRQKQTEGSQEERQFELTFYKVSARSQAATAEIVQQASFQQRRQWPFTPRRKASQQLRISTETSGWPHRHAESEANSFKLSSNRLQQSLLPVIEERKGYHSSRRNSQYSTDWIDKLKAKLEVKRIYAEESQRVAQDIQCWKRIKARAGLLKKIKQEKLRLIALYEKQ